ncbi:MAG: SulP family inorganic anion transporter [Gemmatimonadaceae bacterium]|nr:SulP family inorganic anion transporter [Gemmatimonadaceae bacterium]
MSTLLKDFKQDLPASVVVFFVAVPLCLGIALASGAPLFAGLIAGVVGGIVVGGASGSPLGVSGPAAGLAVIVLNAIATLGGSFEAFLAAVVLAGVLQIAMGYLGLGSIAYYFPSSVIKGMLTGIGLLIIIKQIPHALGSYPPPGDAQIVSGGAPSEGTIDAVFASMSAGAVVVAAISLALLIAWDTVLAPRFKLFRTIPGPLAAVAVGIVLSTLYGSGSLPWTLGAHQMVAIPIASSVGEFFGQVTAPDFSVLAHTDVYAIALVLAFVASIETLLCVEATDRLDPQKRITPTNRELKAQGLGNIVSGMIGGLPITQVIVRSSANITFGGRSKLSAILHGFWILLSIATMPWVLNKIPLATLAAVLFVVGYKLAKPALFQQMYRHGWEQFVPFMATVVGILATDLLRGIAIGMGVAVVVVLHHNLRNPFTVAQHEPGTEAYRIQLAEEVSFLNKGRVLQQLSAIPNGGRVVIDATRSKVIDFDVREILREFKLSAPTRDISVEFHGLTLS